MILSYLYNFGKYDHLCFKYIGLVFSIEPKELCWILLNWKESMWIVMGFR